MAEINIRQATVDDVDCILDFIQQLAEYEKLAHEVVATSAQLKRILFGEKKYAEVIIAEIDNNPVGFALYFYNFSTFLAKPGLYLEDLYVVPTARGLKVGKALLVKLAQIAVANDCGRFEWSVLDWNQPAIEFYRAIGAVPMDEWTVQRLSGKALTSLANKSI
jgi:GNAT superfamily N-acetyltransferase